VRVFVFVADQPQAKPRRQQKERELICHLLSIIACPYTLSCSLIGHAEMVLFTPLLCMYSYFRIRVSG